ncbi:hypothetical protein RugamoR64_55740 [Duganella rhizosphaerae]|uniref:hypothetical protein n=1 Tax=Duganella rhizosphaerae TaxID=2885763 RepID=UPI0030EA9281
MKLTGDVEIDSVLPERPSLLEEVMLVPCGVERVILLGGLNAPMLPTFDRGLDIVRFLQQLNGSQTMSELLLQSGEETEATRDLLIQLARHGLLEEGGAAPQPEDEDRFAVSLAPLMDQTRVFRSRAAVADAARLEFSLLGSNAALLERFAARARQAGLRPQLGSDQPDPAQLVICLQDQDQLCPRTAALMAAGHSILLVSFRQSALHIGPMILGQGSANAYCYLDATRGLAFGVNDGAENLQFAVLVHTLTLVLSRCAALRLVNVSKAWDWHGGEPRVSERPIVRRFHLDGRPLAQHAALSSDGWARLERLAGIATPPKRFIGSKMHEVHYDPRHIAAAEEIPRPAHFDSDLVLPVTAQRLLNVAQQLARRVFGYALSGPALKRTTPTGGNLGSPEGIAVLRCPTLGLEILYRYVPVVDQFEVVFTRPLPLGDTQAEPRVWLACLMNLGKAQSKYSTFGLNLVHLDAGVARAFCEATATALGIDLRFEDPGHRLPSVIAALADRAHRYGAGWCAELSAPGWLSALARPKAALKLDQRLAASHALRDYDGLGISVARIERLLRGAELSMLTPIEHKLAEQLVVLLLVREGQGQGSYSFNLKTGLARLDAAQPGQLLPHQLDDLTVQKNLNAAPAAIFMLAPLHDLVGEFGPSGHDMALACVGRWVGHFWLGLKAVRHGGCPAGIMVESDLLRALPREYAQLSGLFSFSFGKVPAR